MTSPLPSFLSYSPLSLPNSSPSPSSTLESSVRASATNHVLNQLSQIYNAHTLKGTGDEFPLEELVTSVLEFVRTGVGYSTTPFSSPPPSTSPQGEGLVRK